MPTTITPPRPAPTTELNRYAGCDDPELRAFRWDTSGNPFRYAVVSDNWANLLDHLAGLANDGNIRTSIQNESAEFRNAARVLRTAPYTNDIETFYDANIRPRLESSDKTRVAVCGGQTVPAWAKF